MKRRQFLETGAIACALALTKSAEILATNASAKNVTAPAKDFELEELTISNCRKA